jgi:hypothetical protein
MTEEQKAALRRALETLDETRSRVADVFDAELPDLATSQLGFVLEHLDAARRWIDEAHG